MPKYVFAYTGDKHMPQSETEMEEVMAAWGAWYGELGDALVDGGAPFGSLRAISPDGAVSEDGSASLTGYSIVQADDIDAATAMAKGCPVLAVGGGVEVNECLDM